MKQDEAICIEFLKVLHQPIFDSTGSEGVRQDFSVKDLIPWRGPERLYVGESKSPE